MTSPADSHEGRSAAEAAPLFLLALVIVGVLVALTVFFGVVGLTMGMLLATVVVFGAILWVTTRP